VKKSTGGKKREERIAGEVGQKQCEKKREGTMDNSMRRIKIGHQKREHGGKNDRIKHKNKKQIERERWYPLVAGRKGIEKMMKRQ